MLEFQRATGWLKTAEKSYLTVELDSKVGVSSQFPQGSEVTSTTLPHNPFI